MGYTDLHSHVLPGIDDGAPDVDTSMTMLRALAQIGFERVVATPHQKASQYLPALEDVRALHAAARERLAAASVPLSLGLAAENYWDATLFERWRGGHIPSYDDDPAEAEEWAGAMWLAFEKLVREAAERFVASYPLGPGLGAWQAREALDNLARALNERAEAGLEAEDRREDPRVLFSTRGEDAPRDALG